jgi:hypothetical protein
VFSLCQTLFDQFNEDDIKAASALVNRRNDELHTGASAFEEYKPKQWLSGFYRVCDALTKAMGESLESLFGEEEASIARRILADTKTEVKGRVLALIASYGKTFNDRTPDARRAAAESSAKEAEELSHRRHHRVTCPACGSVGTVQGEAFGPERVINEEDRITVKRKLEVNIREQPTIHQRTTMDL